MMELINGPIWQFKIEGEPCIDSPTWNASDTSTIIKDCSSYWFKTSESEGLYTCDNMGHIKTSDGISGNEACW